MAEESVVTLLNGGASTLPPGHRWEGHDHAVADRLRDDFPRLRSAEHGGNTYQDAGDIRLMLGRTDVATVELKFSQKRGSVGTAANISQDALTLYCLYPEAVPWSQWRTCHSFAADVEDLLRRSPRAREAQRIEEMGQARRIEEMGRTIRDLADAGNAEAVEIRDKVRARARDDRLAYVSYLRTQDPDVDRIRAFCLCIFVGAHTKRAIAARLAGFPDAILDGSHLYAVYFTNVRQHQIVCRVLGNDALEAVAALSDFRIEVGDGDTISGRFVANDRSGVKREILTFIHHWKNVFAGVKTPCINVFLGSYLTRLLDV